MTSTSASASSSDAGGCGGTRRRGVPRALAAVLAFALAEAADAAVFYAKDEALRLAFDGAAVRTHTVFLTDDQAAAVRRRTGLDLESKLLTYYTGERDGVIVGYALIDTHVVRTLPETFLVVISPAGAIERVVLLAFYEPPEYLPAPRWLEQFHGRVEEQGWRLGHDVHGISGATLTAHAVSEGLRRALALHAVVMQPRAPR
jgi:hypothetical protein